MNIFETIIVDLIYLLFPLLCYWQFISHQKICGKETSKILFDLALFTSLYLLLRYGVTSTGMGTILIIIPLLIACLNHKDFTGIIMSLVIGIYYYNLHLPLYIIFLELSFYMTIYLIYYETKKYFDVKLTNSFIFVKIFFILFEMDYLFPKHISILNVIIIIIMFCLISKLICYIVKRGEDSTSLKISIKELEKQKQLRESLFKITHEIKNPLAVCKGYIDMFDVDNKQHAIRYVPIIKQEIDRTLTLMNDFLNLTKLKVEKNKLDMSVLLGDLCESLKTLIKANHIKFKCDIFDDEIYIWGDYNRLKQVFINIMKNAIEAIPDDKDGIIKFIAKKNNKEIIITIEDNGIGMDKDTLNKIGEPFFTTKKSGTGLGIRLSKEIIEAHEGEINFKSDKNKGTIIDIMLPILKNP